MKASLRSNNSGKNISKILRFDSGAPKEWIIFMDLVQKALIGQNVTTDHPMYECMGGLLKVEAKVKFTQQANLAGSCTVKYHTTVMATITIHIFLVLVYQD